MKVYCISFVCILTLFLAPLTLGKGRAEALEKSSPALKVALFVDASAGDTAYNASLSKGLEQAKQQWGIDYSLIPSSDPARHEADFIRIAGAGYDLVIIPTIPFHTLLMNNAGNFAKTRFASIGTTIKAPNVMSVTFAKAEGAFLAGAAAALWTQHMSTAAGTNEDAGRKIGWIGGQDIPQSQGYLTGFRQGAKSVDPEIRILSVFTGSFTDPAAGKEAALKMYAEGATVIMHAAGNTGQGVLDAIREQPVEKGCTSIGMGMEQDAEAPGRVLLSEYLRADMAVLAIVQKLVENSFKGGTALEMDLSNQGVGITDMQSMEQAMLRQSSPKDASPYTTLFQSMRQRLHQLSQDIQNKKIKVDTGASRGLCDCL